MADVSITREAVEAAARAMAGKLIWDRMSPLLQHRYREIAMTALNAAAPLIAAEKDVEIQRLQADADLLTGLRANGVEDWHGYEDAVDYAADLRAIGEKRAQS